MKYVVFFIVADLLVVAVNSQLKKIFLCILGCFKSLISYFKRKKVYNQSISSSDRVKVSNDYDCDDEE